MIEHRHRAHVSGHTAQRLREILGYDPPWLHETPPLLVDYELRDSDEQP